MSSIPRPRRKPFVANCRGGRKLEEARKNIEWCDGSPELLTRLEATRPVPEAEVLIHGDLALDNVLIDENDSLALIDWSGATLETAGTISRALATEPEIHLLDADVLGFFEGYGGNTVVDTELTRWFTDLYEFF